MNIRWFTSSRSVNNVTVSDLESYRILFTGKPKGIRLNAALTKRVLAMECTHLRIGLGKTTLIIKPVTEDEQEGAFKLIVNKATSGQVCSAAIGDWAVKNRLLKERLLGEWDEEQEAFIFTFSKSDKGI